MEHAELVHVYSVKNPTEAEAIKLAMEDEGIACFVEGEGQAGLTGVLDIRLFVRADDAARARALIQEHERRSQEAEAPSETEPGEETEEDQFE